MKKGIRMDLYLVQQGFVQSREKAQAIIMAGEVLCNEVPVVKSSFIVQETDKIRLKNLNGNKYVSRGGYKLEKALKTFDINVSNKVALDIGASTGGFSDVLLKSGAKHVYAVDVGYGQYDWSLRNDKRVTLYEKTNARNLEPSQFILPVDLAVIDVSFISITLLIEKLFDVMKEDSFIVSLIKPQFEVGKENVGKNGVVRDREKHIECISKIRDFLNSKSYVLSKLSYSPITGPKGNIEFLALIEKNNPNISSIDKEYINVIVNQAHENLIKNNI